MATYKLIQDIEAEDHILGPLSLRQFIFGLIAAFLGYLCFIIIVKHVYFLLVVFLPPMLFCAFFAVPFGRDQPTEVWALAKLRFWFKPRRRIWDQSGVKELVTITVPKKVEKILTKGYDQTEVQSRLKALANTLDSRGWVIKNPTANTYQSQLAGTPGSDRLVEIDPLPQEVPNYDAQPSDDILDETNNPTAHKFENMITASSRAHRKQLIDELNNIRTDGAKPTKPANNYWFMSKTAPQTSAASAAPAIAAVPLSPAQPASDATAHLRTLRPDSTVAVNPQAAQAAPAAQQPPAPTVTPQSDPAILALADRNDLNVSTLAREVHRAKNGDGSPQDEVVVSLH